MTRAALRPVTPPDLLAAARVLLAQPRGRWPRKMARLLAAAGAAERHRRATGRAHPRLGNGTLAAAALAQAPPPAPPLDDARHLAALADAARAVLARRGACKHTPYRTGPRQKARNVMVVRVRSMPGMSNNRSVR